MSSATPGLAKRPHLAFSRNCKPSFLRGTCGASWTATRRLCGDDMLVLVTYDVRTDTKEGRRRLRQVARAWEDYGQRAQLSVFECDLDPGLCVRLRARLIDLIDPEQDSLRFYVLGREGRRRSADSGGLFKIFQCGIERQSPPCGGVRCGAGRRLRASRGDGGH